MKLILGQRSERECSCCARAPRSYAAPTHAASGRLGDPGHNLDHLPIIIIFIIDFIVSSYMEVDMREYMHSMQDAFHKEAGTKAKEVDTPFISDECFALGSPLPHTVCRNASDHDHRHRHRPHHHHQHHDHQRQSEL